MKYKGKDNWNRPSAVSGQRRRRRMNNGQAELPRNYLHHRYEYDNHGTIVAVLDSVSCRWRVKFPHITTWSGLAFRGE